MGADNVVHFNNQRLQILSSAERASYAHCKVEVQQRLNGSLAIYYEGKRLPTQPAPLEARKLRETVTTVSLSGRTYTKPAPDHPWRGKFRHF